MVEDKNKTQDNNQNNNTQNNNTQSNNTQSNNTQNSGSHTYAIGMDRNAQSDFGNIKKIQQLIQSAGHKAETTQIGPNQESYLTSKAKEINADIAVFCCAFGPATIWSFRNSVKAGTLPHTIFALEGWITKVSSIQDALSRPFVKEHDANFMSASDDAKMKAEASTLGEWLNKGNSQYISVVYGKTPEELAQAILSASFGGTANTNGDASSSGGSGAQIKDKTFEDCIRRICAATDSVFVVENNAAVLFPYTDWMAFTLQKQIHTIQAKEIDPDVFEKQYSPDGTYNKVTATWGGEELPDRDFNKTNKTDTISSTKGKVTTKEKNNKDGTVMLSKQYDELVDTFGELEKRVELKVNDRNTAEYIVNALLIQYVREFNNAYKVRTLNQRKYIGGTFYAIENPFDKKVVPLYLNGYSIRTQKNTPLYADLDFRYGPLGVEDIENYQNYSGSGGGSGTSNEESSTESSGQSLGSNAIEVGNALAAKYTYKQHAGSESYGAMKKKGYGSCYAWSGALYTELKAIGYTVRVVQCVTKYSNTHRSVQYKDKSGNWVDYPYRDTKIDKMAWATSGSKNGKVVLDENGNGPAKGILK